MSATNTRSVYHNRAPTYERETVKPYPRNKLLAYAQNTRPDKIFCEHYMNFPAALSLMSRKPLTHTFTLNTLRVHFICFGKHLPSFR